MLNETTISQSNSQEKQTADYDTLTSNAEFQNGQNNHEFAERDTIDELEHYGETLIDISQKLEGAHQQTEEPLKLHIKEEDINSTLSEQQKQAINNFTEGLKEYERLYATEYDKADTIINEAVKTFNENSKGLWSRDYAIETGRQIHAIQDPTDAEGYDDADAWQLINAFDMPIRVIVENPDFYDKMLEQHNRIGNGYLAKIYKEMAKTDDGQRKFKEDFIDNGNYAELARTRVLNILYELKIDNKELDDLKLLKEYGVCVFDDIAIDGIRPMGLLIGQEEDEYKNKLKEVTRELIENKVFDDAEYSRITQKVIDSALNHEFVSKDALSIVTTAQEYGLNPRPDSSEAVKYWDEISKKAGRNMLELFTNRHSQYDKEILNNLDLLDFSQETVMRLFADRYTDDADSISIEKYQNPKLLDAINQPKFQDIILETIEEQVEKRAAEAHSNSPNKVPKILLMLMQDRQIIKDMQRRKAFDNYPSCRQISTIDAIANGNFTEKERLKFYIPSEYFPSSNFDDNGEPNANFYARMTGYWGFIHDKSERQHYSIVLDPTEKTNLSKAQQLSEHVQTFMQGNRGQKIVSMLNGDNNPFSIELETALKYFNETGPRPELWRFFLQKEEYQFLLKQNEETRITMGLNGAEMAFLDTYQSSISSQVIGNIHPREIPKYFDETGPKQELWQHCLQNKDYQFLSEQSDETKAKMGFSEAEVAFLNSYKRMLTSTVIQNMSPDEIPKYFDETGPKQELWQQCLQSRDYQFLSEQSDETKAKMGFSEAEVAFLDTYQNFMSSRVIGNMRSREIPKYFDETGPKQELWQHCLQSKDYLFLSDQSDEAKAKMGFSEAEVAFLNSYKRMLTSTVIQKLSPDEISKYFDGTGPKAALWLDSFANKDFDFIYKQDMDTRNNMPFDEKHNEAIDGYGRIDDDAIKDLYKNYIIKNLERTNVETIPEIADTLNNLTYSNAEEISSHPIDFAKAILENTSSELVKEKMQEIESVFVKNNIPYVGKVYRTFRILYPTGSFPYQMERGALKGRIEAPANPDTLPSNIAEYRQLIESKDSVLFANLLRASLESNNRDLRKYLINLQKGASLAEQVIDGTSKVSEEDERILEVYLEHLDTIYRNTQKGKIAPFQRTGNTIEDVRNISKEFTPNERFSVPDRIVQSFGYMLGIKTCSEAIERIDRAVAEADARNRKAAAEGNFKLESGDIIKSLDVEYLGPSLRNGFLCKEFLNGQVKSDTTPLDSDVNVLPDGLSGDISEGVNKKNEIAAFEPKSCMVVMKGDANSGRNRFVTESENGTYDPQKYEIWQNDESNYGILVGFASTGIDYMIHDSIRRTGEDNDLDRMKYEIVKNDDFYTPIVDKAGRKLVFSPDEYDKMKLIVLGLREFTKDGKSKFITADAPERALVKDLSIPEYVLPDGVKIEGTEDTIVKLQNNKEEVDKKRDAIKNEVLLPILQQFNLSMREELSGDLTEGVAEVIDTGSTGRYSNAPGDGDFDFMMKLDRKITKDKNALESIRNAFCDKLGLSYEDIVKSGNIRAKNVKLSGLEETVDIDVTFSTKTNKVKYSTDVALGQFYESMTEEQRRIATANVIFAKRLLKHAKAYKPDRGDVPQGGLGGVGIENWVLQNGGSFVAAAESFMKVANECGENFEQFKMNYSLIDFGENHVNGLNDNFVARNMSKEGYNKMRTALGEFLASYKQTETTAT